MHSVSGHIGVVRCGYQAALRLTSWKLVPSAFGEFSLTADAEVVSQHWLAQRPLDVELEVGEKSWTWRNVDPVVAGGRVAFKVRGRPQ